MPTFFNFTAQPNTAPFRFQPTLDGTVYNVTVTWNMYGQRWYVNLFGLDGTHLITIPLVASQVSLPVSDLFLMPISATHMLTGKVWVTTLAPHNYPVGERVELVISGIVPAAFNGTWLCDIAGDNSFFYEFDGDPGPVTLLGNYAKEVSLVKGYFDSTLVWRAAQNRFEVNP